jgi:hypothetical protein
MTAPGAAYAQQPSAICDWPAADEPQQTYLDAEGNGGQFEPVSGAGCVSAV